MRLIVNATLKARDVALWGEGTSCASDSRKFGSWSANFMTEWHQVLPRPSAAPDPTSTGGTRRCDGWCQVLGCGHERDQDPDAQRGLRPAAGR
ncbi:Tn3 family transposase [Nonomuraea jabiensis]|uniref:Tn3 family transposase n=1 Tax=Nonomuraea jabiensis TaxID=882448 RepID=UPI0036B70E3F